MELICWLVDISFVAIPVLPIVEPIQVTRTLPLGNALVFEKPFADNIVFVSEINFIVPKSAGEAQRYVPFS